MLSIPGFAPALALMAPREGGASSTVFLLQIGAMVAIFYFLLIRPQQKEQKRHKAMLAALKKGDEVVTNGGIIGSVVHVEDDRLTVKTADNTRLTVQRGRIAQVLGPRDAAGTGPKS